MGDGMTAEMGLGAIMVGDCRETLRGLAAGSVQCVVTSPPYWGLRVYQDGEAPVEPVVWGGGPDCEHQWGEALPHGRRGNRGVSGTGGNLHPALAAAGSGAGSGNSGTACTLCGAWLGCLGAEPLHDCLAWARGEDPCPTCYVCHLRTVARELWRVLRDDGVMWLNLGSTMNSNPTKSGFGLQDGKPIPHFETGTRAPGTGNCRTPGLKPTDLVMIPALVALALQADGWFLRSDVIWAKPNPMPSSCTSRPSNAHEHIFMLTKRPGSQAYFDMEAVKEPQRHTSVERAQRADMRGKPGWSEAYHGNPPKGLAKQSERDTSTGRHLRDVWTIPTRGVGLAHFAVFPLDIPARCIRASTSEVGCCPSCGAPWQRVMERTEDPDTSAKGSRFDAGKTAARDGGDRTQPGERTTKRTAGWRPGCECGREDVQPCLVLDPFFGAGTTGLAAQKLGRRWVGSEISERYAEMAALRIRAGGKAKLMDEFEGAEKVGQRGLFSEN